jgi:putative ATP-dependent endonuclease of the OLD family
MFIERVIIENFKSLKRADVHMQNGINIVVGNNEVGKSTLIEAINLALRCQLNRRSALQELHPYVINNESVTEFIASHRVGKKTPPPRALIELYLHDSPKVAHFKGTNNSLSLNAAGVSLSIQLDQKNFSEEYESYVSDPSSLTSIPIEFYEIIWQSFAGELLSARSMPLRSALIDASMTGNTPSAQRYVLEVIRDYLNKDQSAKLALAYRAMREEFQNDERIAKINDELLKKKDLISDRNLTIALDTTSRASWEVGILPHLNSIPLSLVGKGEQNSVKIKLAIQASSSTEVVLIEEPENHLTHTNLGKLTSHIAERCKGKQVVITTHSSYVMNKLGVESVIMFDGVKGISLRSLSEETQSFFKRLPGHDTLRMVLAAKTILVEGPSDELVVQKAYLQIHKKLPLEMGHEVISVGTSFKRFLDIAVLLNLKVYVVCDNDRKSVTKIKSFESYANNSCIRICIDSNDELNTLEPHLVNSNGLAKINSILSTAYSSEAELISYMIAHKTNVALQIFESQEDIGIPKYIEDAVR